MQTRWFLNAWAQAFVVVLVAMFLAAPANPRAQSSAALTGVVSSDEEGQMEGVVVNAQRDGATFTVSVVSDAQGRYSFPRTHLAPGVYALTIRAVGYDLVDPGSVDVAASTPATQDLTFRTTTDLASQLSSLEWLMSMPGTPDQKSELVHQLLSCAYCHTYERIMKSRHNAEEMVPVISRMSTYFQDGTAVGRGGRGRAVRNENTSFAAQSTTWGFTPPVPKTELAEYLASVNLSGGRTTWPYELKTLPRPTGQATRVIMTQYDMPRRGMVPHDVEVDSTGTPWYGDQSRMYIGQLNSQTGEFTDHPLPELPSGRVGGIRLYPTVYYLFNRLESMPSNDVASIGQGTRTDIAAYLLKANGFPRGPKELPDNPQAMKAMPLDEPGFEPVFNGKDFTGIDFFLGPNCTPAPEGCGKTDPDPIFKVRDGVLVCSG